MPVDADVAFNFMRANYAAGMLDKTGSLLGQALDAWMRETGLDMGDLLMALDGASEEAVDRLNRLVRFAGPLLRLGANERMLRLQSRLLERPRVQAAFIFIAKHALRRTFRNLVPAQPVWASILEEKP